MAVQGVTVTLTTDLAANALAGTFSGDSQHGVIRVVLRNNGSGTVYLGSSGVTSGGYALTTADSPLPIVLYGGESLYGMTTGGAATVSVLRMNETS